VKFWWNPGLGPYKMCKWGPVQFSKDPMAISIINCPRYGFTYRDVLEWRAVNTCADEAKEQSSLWAEQTAVSVLIRESTSQSVSFLLLSLGVSKNVPKSVTLTAGPFRLWQPRSFIQQMSAGCNSLTWH